VRRVAAWHAEVSRMATLLAWAQAYPVDEMARKPDEELAEALMDITCRRPYGMGVTAVMFPSPVSPMWSTAKGPSGRTGMTQLSVGRRAPHLRGGRGSDSDAVGLEAISLNGRGARGSVASDMPSRAASRHARRRGRLWVFVSY